MPAATQPDSAITRWYLIPAGMYLIVTLVTGLWIRLMWTFGWSMLDVRHLIHAHSHLGMLGWLHLAIAGLFIRYLLRPESRRVLLSPWLMIPTHLIVVAMTISFALEGYAFRSILTSTLFIGIVTIFAVEAWLTLRSDLNSTARWLAKAAIVLLLVSNVGPLALGGGTKWGIDWIQFWVTWYLHFQFSGWIPVAILALLLAVRADTKTVPVAGINAFLAGSVLLLEPLLRTEGTSAWIQSVGLSGGILGIWGTFVLVRHLYKYASDKTGILFQIALAALLVKALFQLMSAVPGIGHQFLETHLLVIAFAHLLLLGIGTPLLVDLIGVASGYHDASGAAGNTRIRSSILITGEWVLAIGITAMIMALFIFGICQHTGTFPWIPLQETIAWLSAPVIAGALLVLGSWIAK